MELARVDLAAVLGILMGLVSSCGDHHPVNELNVVGVELLTAPDQVIIGHDVSFKVTVEATSADHDVAVSLDLLDKDGVDTQATPLVHFLIGHANFPEIDPGENSGTFTFRIPTKVTNPDTGHDELLVPGDYYVGAHVDPVNAKAETNEDDNHHIVPDLVVSLQASDLHDIVLEDLTFDDEVVVLHDEVGAPGEPVEGYNDDPDDHFDGVLTVSVTGVEVLEVFELTAYVELSGQGLGPGQQLEPILLWNTAIEPVSGNDIGGYETTLKIPDLEPGSPRCIHLDFHIPEATRTAMLDKMATATMITCEVVVFADEMDSVPEIGSANNVIVRELVFMAESPEPLCVEEEENYDKTFGDNNFGAKLFSDTCASVNSQGVGFAKEFGMNLQLFAASFTFFGVDVVSNHNPAQHDESEFQLSLSALGIKILGVNEGFGFTLTASCDEQESNEGNKKCLEFAKSVEKEYPFTIGPVPLVLGGEIKGGVEMQLEIDISDEFSISAGPVLSFEVEVTLAVGLPKAIKAGVGGSITIFEGGVSAKVVAELGVESCTSSSQSGLKGEFRFEVVSEISGPAGNIFLFVDFPGIKWCWFGPCGIHSVRLSLTLAEFAPWKKEDVLLGPFVKPIDFTCSACP